MDVQSWQECFFEVPIGFSLSFSYEQTMAEKNHSHRNLYAHANICYSHTSFTLLASWEAGRSLYTCQWCYSPTSFTLLASWEAGRSLYTCQWCYSPTSFTLLASWEAGRWRQSYMALHQIAQLLKWTRGYCGGTSEKQHQRLREKKTDCK